MYKYLELVNSPSVLSSENEKKKKTLIGNLSLLQGLQKYKGIGITEDLTIEERKPFKSLAEEAKQKIKEIPIPPTFGEYVVFQKISPKEDSKEESSGINGTKINNTINKGGNIYRSWGPN